MHKKQSTEISTQSWGDPTELRINVVGHSVRLRKQHFFLLKTPLTPLNVEHDGMEYDPESHFFLIKSGFEQAIP